jgi:16S rRNA (guanine1207-N2)-methyltransferase
MNAISAPSQLIIRQAERLQQQHWLLVNAPDSAVAAELEVAALWHLHAGAAQQWQSHAAPQQFGATPPQLPLQLNDANAALLWLPKEKPLADYLLHAIATLLPLGSEVWLVGENRGGIKSIDKLLGEYYAPLQKVAIGNHSLLLATHIKSQPKPFALENYLLEQQLPQPGFNEPLRLHSLPGVFAYPSIDDGSAMLLKHLPHWQQGSVLDFACGHGVLGAWLNRASPALKVSYLDVSAMALAAAAATLASNNLTGELIASDGLNSELPRFDYIVSHPPFHTGLATDYKIGAAFLRQASMHLSSHGELWLVANRFLPWPELITASFGQCQRVAQDNRFAVYRAVRQPSARTTRKGRR